MHVPRKKQTTVTYRSYKHFDESKFLSDLNQTPFHLCEVFDDINDAYWCYEHLLFSIINEHAPIKTRKIKHNQVPYMNGELRKAINVKNMLRRKFDKVKSSRMWEKYRAHINLVTKLRKKSIKSYIGKQCNNDDSRGTFWKTIKPLISNKSTVKDDCINLHEGDNVINNPLDVCHKFNDYFSSIANGIGSDDFITPDDNINTIIDTYKTHDSDINIKERCNGNHFSFKRVSHNHVRNKLNNLNVRKATGYDLIPPKMLKLGCDALSFPVTYLINNAIECSTFPQALKSANVKPIFKKGNHMDTTNYRPVN